MEFPNNASSVSTHSIWLENTSPKFRETDWATAETSISRPSSYCIEVTGFDAIPQGTIKSK